MASQRVLSDRAKPRRHPQHRRHPRREHPLQLLVVLTPQELDQTLQPLPKTRPAARLLQADQRRNQIPRRQLRVRQSGLVQKIVPLRRLVRARPPAVEVRTPRPVTVDGGPEHEALACARAAEGAGSRGRGARPPPPRRPALPARAAEHSPSLPASARAQFHPQFLRSGGQTRPSDHQTGRKYNPSSISYLSWFETKVSWTGPDGSVSMRAFGELPQPIDEQ